MKRRMVYDFADKIHAALRAAGVEFDALCDAADYALIRVIGGNAELDRASEAIALAGVGFLSCHDGGNRILAKWLKGDGK